MVQEAEEEDEEEDEPEEDENWPDSYYQEIGVSQLESASEPSFELLMPVLLPAEDLEEGAARDPEKEAREAARQAKIAERKALRRLLKQRLADEEARLELERLMN